MSTEQQRKKEINKEIKFKAVDMLITHIRDIPQSLLYPL